MGRSNQDLIALEGQNSSFKESTLLVCKKDDFLQFKTTKTNPPATKPTISSVPKSQVLGKVKDFLGVMEDANKSLQLDAMDKSKDYNIEAALTGNESEYIEMNLMLGVADLHTPEAVAAAESAIAGCQHVVSLGGCNSGVETDNYSDDDDYDDTNDDGNDERTCSPTKLKRRSLEDESSYGVLKNCQTKKRPKIVELS